MMADDGIARLFTIAHGLSFACSYDVRSIEKARALIGAPEAEEAGKASGVLDGGYHFVEDSKAY
jgi:hypothetical protein